MTSPINERRVGVSTDPLDHSAHPSTHTHTRRETDMNQYGYGGC